MKYISTFGFDSKIGSFVAVDNNGNYMKDDDTSDQMKFNMEERCIELINRIEEKAKEIINNNLSFNNQEDSNEQVNDLNAE